jgi:C4-dicarboxylate transporter DctM subunit
LSAEIVALLLLFVFVGLIVIRVPIGFALGMSGILGLILMDQSFMMFPQTLISGINNFALMAIPFYVLLGVALEKTNISESLIKLADEVFGFLPGGMAVGTVISSMLFATASGSGPATVAAIGSITIPQMEKRGYSKRFAVGTSASAGALGPIIPPSIPLIIYGVVAEESIVRLFFAGLGAGILFAVLLCLVCMLKAKLEKVPLSEERPSLRRIAAAFWRAKVALAAPIIVLGGIYAGVFTPTEAGAIGSIYVILAGLMITRSLSLRDLYDCFAKTASTSAMIMFVIAVAYLFAWLMSAARVPHLAAESMLAIASNKVVFLLLVNLLFLFIGSVLDTPAAIVIIVPILLPVAEQFSIHPIHFGTVVVVNFVIGYITAPFGYNLFVAKSITDMSMEEVTLSVIPFLAVALAGLGLITFIPEISLFFPSLFMG